MDCVGGDVHIQIVGHQHIKLHPQQTSLGQHGAVLFDEIPEILGQSRIADDDSFPEQGANFGAADIEYIAQTGNILQRQVIFLGGKTVAQSSAIQEQIQPQFPAGLGQSFQFGQGVQRTQLRGIGNVDQLGLDGVLETAVCPVGQHSGAYLLGRDFSVRGRQGQHLMSRCFHSSGFVGVNMSADSTQRPLMGPQRGINHCQIGLGSAYQKVHCQIFSAAQRLDLGGSGGTVAVFSVSRCLFQIGAAQCL